jgi:CheY-like chemotaxis protein
MVHAPHVRIRPVLLIDDNHDDLFILKRLLTRAGVMNAFISFDHARDCSHFLASALRTPETQLLPAAVFCDKSMPEYDGFDLLKWVREQKPLATLPFVLLSSVVEPSERKRAQKLHATAVFEKFPAPHVLTEIFGAIRQKRDE